MRKFKVPNTYVIIAAIIALCAVLTWIVPGGQYVKADDGTLSYEAVDAVPQTWQVLSAIYHGFVKQAGIIVFILVVGGAFWLLNATGAWRRASSVSSCASASGTCSCWQRSRCCFHWPARCSG